MLICVHQTQDKVTACLTVCVIQCLCNLEGTSELHAADCCAAAAAAAAAALQECADLVQVVPPRPSLCPSQGAGFCEKGAVLCSPDHVGQVWESCAP